MALSDEAEMYKEENVRLKDYLNDFTEKMRNSKS